MCFTREKSASLRNKARDVFYKRQCLLLVLVLGIRYVMCFTREKSASLRNKTHDVFYKRNVF